MSRGITTREARSKMRRKVIPVQELTQLPLTLGLQCLDRTCKDDL